MSLTKSGVAPQSEAFGPFGFLPSETSPEWNSQAVFSCPTLDGVIWSEVAYFWAFSWPVKVYQAWLPSLAVLPACCAAAPVLREESRHEDGRRQMESAHGG